MLLPLVLLLLRLWLLFCCCCCGCYFVVAVFAQWVSQSIDKMTQTACRLDVVVFAAASFSVVVVVTTAVVFVVVEWAAESIDHIK